MSAAKAAAAPSRPPKGKDRFGLRPPRKGRIRGQIANVRRSFEVGAFGNLLIVDFDLLIDQGVPPVPVRMSGTIFNQEPREGMLVEVADPDPTVRPIVAHRLQTAWDRHSEIVAFYPGRDDLSPARQRMIGLLVLLIPVVVGAALLGVFFAYGR